MESNLKNLPKRTTKTSQKLKIFPENSQQNPSFNQSNVNNLTSVNDEEWISQYERKWLPRVTGYCTANSYNMDSLFDDLKQKSKKYNTNPKRLDEVIYTPFSFHPVSSKPFNDVSKLAPTIDPITLLSLPPNTSLVLQNIDCYGQPIPDNLPFESLAKRIAPVGECFFFDYGVVVMWGLSEQEESIMLDYLVPFQNEVLTHADVETEELHFHYNMHCQPRIFNDVITLKNPANSKIKLTISHAISQSVKLSVYEDYMEETIDSTKHVPSIMAEEGKIRMSRHAINKKIGQLFIMRINVNLVSNVLDTPEIFWSEPALEPLYMAIRGYLEISQRVDLLNQRVGVIGDLLDMLKEHLNSSHGEQLEWIVIILIAFEIVIGIITISFDLTTYFRRP